jgi:hypothetical protein
LKNRILLGSFAALAVMAFGVASASATTINNKGPFAPISGLVTFNIINASNHSSNLKVTCNNSILPGTVNADSTITGGKPTFSGCTAMLGTASFGPVAITPLEPVHYSMVLNAAGVSTVLTKINWSIYLSNYNCGMNYAGSATTSTPGSAPVSVTKLALASVLRRTGFKGPSPFCEELFANFGEAQFSSTYDLSPPLVFTN